MTKVKVAAGACGFTSVIKVEQESKTRLAVQIFSACERLRRMAGDFNEIDWHSGVFVGITDSIIYRSADRQLIHSDCPVPSAILKAILIEVNAMTPKEVTMTFEKRKGEEDQSLLCSLNPDVKEMLKDPQTQAVIRAVRDLNSDELRDTLDHIHYFKKNGHME